jgi:Rrf2 family protein
MKLQVSTSLALCSVLEFAARSRDQVSTADIALKYDASSHHLAKVLRELVRANIIESTRGVGGGYRFVANARRLTLMDVIALFEDIGEQAAEAGSTDVERALGVVLAEIDEIAKSTFRSLTIETMLKLIGRQRHPGHEVQAPRPKRPRATRRTPT